MKKNGYAVIELVIVLAVFSVGYFFVANKVSYLFNVNYNKDLYEQKISSIEKQATLYGLSNKDLFKTEKDVYVTVDELAVKGFVISNDGVVKDPRSENNKLNDVKVKISKEEDNIVAKVLV
ncbi:MAG: hypothetical protein RSD29_04320 [Bacilli bacterium]